MKIAIDAMGGDHAPGEIVKGALKAAKVLPDIQIILVGQKDKIDLHIPEDLKGTIEIYECFEVIEMDEHPAAAIKKKKDASIVVATRLVKEGYADALVSAGSTGAQMASALLGLGRIKGINRPAICTVLPTLQGGKLLLDVGANPDAKPENLLQYAMMGSIYAEKILGLKSPKVALLNIGSEEGKGNELVQSAYDLLKQSSLNFVGNIEGRDIPYGTADVIVCDAFVGNIVLKTIEGMSSSLFQLIKQKITTSTTRKIGAMLVKPGLKEIAHMLDYSEYGGAPLLGVNGTSIICHGSSKENAIFNAVRVAKECIQGQIIEKIADGLEKSMQK
ncbi:MULTISPECIES: phosphate acyltransferase PlsX [unclassified Dehalobacter]|uniref:phosphate acyltransferase PlsX n=1 Tax=unclassified Dehalobacter TaxID=2635733 RepID=UPI000E6C3590|nr:MULTISPECIES: phosphate acyltransferase PlsX [unclassified Dehalobacter]RJE49211.1 phosphate acyltransferase [Dehalobacter sp. MCB1]TCX53253.1 phosphate acyltransferase PlsX [Dehalobacter sp. 14DCB1]TCX54267.1 phosphate acyltransferase PlsX [Dehalobacter sp. 12DCB1]